MDTCPNCGYCKHCGRGGHQVYPIYPPMWPYPSWGVLPPNWTGGFVPTTTTGISTGSVTINNEDPHVTFTVTN